MRYLRLMLLLPMLGRLLLADTAPGTGGGQGGDGQGGATGSGQGSGGNSGAGTGQTFTQADLDRVVGERLARERQQSAAELERLRARAAVADQLEAASRTDLERAQADARAAGVTEGRRALMPLLVAAELRAASGGQLTTDQVTALTAPLSPDYFVGSDGNVDPAKVTAWVGGIPGLAQQQGQSGQQGANGGQAGQQGQNGQQQGQGAAQGTGQGQQQNGQQGANGGQAGQGGQQWPGMGQGQRGAAVTSGKQAGLDEARRRYGDKTAQQGQAQQR